MNSVKDMQKKQRVRRESTLIASDRQQGSFIDACSLDDGCAAFFGKDIPEEVVFPKVNERQELKKSGFGLDVEEVEETCIQVREGCWCVKDAGVPGCCVGISLAGNVLEQDA